jgi:hypothetical protein
MASATVDHANSDDRVNYFRGWSDGGKGAFGTVVVGYDHQFSPSIVAGAFVDYDFGGSKVQWNDVSNNIRIEGNLIFNSMLRPPIASFHRKTSTGSSSAAASRQK